MKFRLDWWEVPMLGPSITTHRVMTIAGGAFVPFKSVPAGFPTRGLIWTVDTITEFLLLK